MFSAVFVVGSERLSFKVIIPCSASCHAPEKDVQHKHPSQLKNPFPDFHQPPTRNSRSRAEPFHDFHQPPTIKNSRSRAAVCLAGVMAHFESTILCQRDRALPVGRGTGSLECTLVYHVYYGDPEKRPTVSHFAQEVAYLF